VQVLQNIDKSFDIPIPPTRQEELAEVAEVREQNTEESDAARPIRAMDSSEYERK
jgi:hypothetical protein